MDKTVYCPGDTAIITITGAVPPYQTYWNPISIITEHYIYSRSVTNCNQSNCSTQECIVNVQGNNVISHDVISRTCNSPQLQRDTVIIKILALATSSYHVNWDSETRETASPICGVPNDTTYYIWRFEGDFTLPVANITAPVLSPSAIRINQGQMAAITIVPNFGTSNRKMNIYQSDCETVQPIVSTLTLPNIEPYIYNAYYYNLGKTTIKAQKVEVAECPSQISNPVEIIVKPCQIVPYGCNQNIVNFIESKSCNIIAQQPADYHFYSSEKTVCSSGCDLDSYWQSYKNNITNQIPLPTDQFGSYGPSAESFKGMFFNNILFPYVSPSGPITDNCNEIRLASPWTFAITLGRVTSANSSNLFSFAHSTGFDFDPVFTRISENKKCVTNYTLPGHIFYPGKVTRCLVQECDKIKILTFGEGTTRYNTDPLLENTVGRAFKNANEFFGPKIFDNVDTRAAQYLQNNHRISSFFDIQPTSSFTTNENLLYKPWRIKSFKIKYPDNDTVFTIYNRGDTLDFWKMSSVKLSLMENGTYKANSVLGSIVSGTWSFDASASKLVIDTGSAFISFGPNMFTVSGNTNVFENNGLLNVNYYLEFEEYSKVVTWKGTISSAWENPANWSDGNVPDETSDVVINEANPYKPVISAPTKCRSLKVSNNLLLTVNSNLQLMNKSQ